MSGSPVPNMQTQSNEKSNDSEKGRLSFRENRFERILTVPNELQFGLLRWTSEFDVCDKAVLVGKALDIMVALYCELLLQLSRTSSSRERFMQAPTEFMVAPMYYCDRVLDGILHSIADVRKNINELCSQLRALHVKCLQNQNAAQKVCQEVEMDAKPEMVKFIEERRAKVAVFRELSQRISSVQDGENIFRFLDKPWCQDSAVCSQLAAHTTPARPRPSHPVTAVQAATPDDVGKTRSEIAGKEQQGSNADNCTPENPNPKRQQNPGGAPHFQRELTVPETPEQERPLNPDGPITQASSPRKTRSLSRRKRTREGHVSESPPVVRNLIQDASQPSETDALKCRKVAKKTLERTLGADDAAPQERTKVFNGCKRQKKEIVLEDDASTARRLSSKIEGNLGSRRQSKLGKSRCANAAVAKPQKPRPEKGISSESQ